MATRQNWSTPPELFSVCDNLFGPYDLDVCAESWNAKCSTYYSIMQNGLKQSWAGHNFWCNPPYTQMGTSVVGDWCSKAVEEAKKGAIGTMLLKNDCSTKWFTDIIVPSANKIVFLLGKRIAFHDRDGAQDNSNITHLLAVFDQSIEKQSIALWDWRTEPSLSRVTTTTVDQIERLKTQNERIFERYKNLKREYFQLRQQLTNNTEEDDNEDLSSE